MEDRRLAEVLRHFHPEGGFRPWHGGPTALGTAIAAGSSGSLDGLVMEAVESLSVKAFSTDTGFIAAEGRLIIELPD